MKQCSKTGAAVSFTFMTSAYRVAHFINDSRLQNADSFASPTDFLYTHSWVISTQTFIFY